MVRTLLAGGLCFLLASVALAQADADAFGELFEDLTLQEALDRSIEQSRVLVVYIDSRSIPYADPVRSEKSLASAIEDRLLRYWLRQHAVAIHLGPEHRELAERIAVAAMFRCERAREVQPNKDDPELRTKIAWYTPAFGVFVNGELFSAVTACRLAPWMDFGARIITPERSAGVGTLMTWAAFELDFQLDRIAAKEPVWMGLHTLRNPPLEAEGRAQFAEVADESASRFDEELLPDRSDVLLAIRMGRTQAEVGDRFGAAATYTWLWEEGAGRDPDFAPAIRTIVTAEVHALAGRWDNFSKRFEDMKSAATRRLGHDSLADFGEWIRLSAVTGDAATMLEELDYRLNSDYFGSLLARDERRVILAIAEAETEIHERAGDAEYELSRLRRLLDRHDREPSALARPELRRLATDRAVLLHARFLESGRENEARAIADLAIERLGPDAGPALVAGALVVGQPRPWHEGLIPLGRSPRLALHLRSAMEGPEEGLIESDSTIRLGE